MQFKKNILINNGVFAIFIPFAVRLLRAYPSISVVSGAVAYTRHICNADRIEYTCTYGILYVETLNINEMKQQQRIEQMEIYARTVRA